MKEQRKGKSIQVENKPGDRTPEGHVELVEDEDSDVEPLRGETSNFVLEKVTTAGQALLMFRVIMISIAA